MGESYCAAKQFSYFFTNLLLYIFQELTPYRASDDEPVDEKAPSMGAKTLCIPFTQPAPIKPGQLCFACDKLAVSYTLWGRSY